jgi:hypothetical protein
MYQWAEKELESLNLVWQWHLERVSITPPEKGATMTCRGERTALNLKGDISHLGSHKQSNSFSINFDD